MKVENLNKTMNFDCLMEVMSDIAYELNTEALIRSNRSNSLSKDEIRFTLESFLYFDNAKPQLQLANELKENVNLIESIGFKKTSLEFNGKLIEYFINKEDDKMIIFEDPLTKNFVLKYENDFMKEKNNSKIRYTNNYLKESVIDVLKENNTYAYADVSSKNVCKIVEKILEQNNIKELGNSVLKEQLSSQLFNMSKELNEEFKNLYDIVYTEDVISGNILPRLTFIDKELNSAEGSIVLAYKESYNNKYSTVVVKAYLEEDIEESLNKFFSEGTIIEYKK